MRQTAILFGLSLFGISAFAADPQLMNLVMPDAKILAGVNVTSAKISPLGQYLITKIPADDKGLASVISATGFDPRQDMVEILVASAGDTAKPGGLLLVRGSFNVPQIVAAATADGHQKVETYAGATLLTDANASEKVPHSVAFLGSSIALAGDTANVKAALDRSGAANSIDPALAVKVNKLSTTEDEWFVSAAPVASLVPPSLAPAKGAAAQGLQILKSVQSFSGAVKLGAVNTLTIEAVTSDEKNAAALEAVIKLGLSLAVMNSGPQADQLTQWLQALQITTSGPAVELSLAVPETQVEALLNAAQVSHPAPAARAARIGRAARR